MVIAVTLVDTVRRRAGHALGGIAMLCAAQAAHSITPCADILPPAAHLVPRTITAIDLVRLRDIGYASLGPGQTLFDVSPNGSAAAFVLYRADPVSNAYCEAVLTSELHAGGATHIVDLSEELILSSVPIRGVEVEYGLPTPIVPRWSPDGRWIAYLKRVAGRTQVWRASLAGHRVEQISYSLVDVVDFAWSADGRSLIYVDEPQALVDARTTDADGRVGWRYDDSIVPYSSTRPALRSPLPRVFHAIDLDTRVARTATPGERARLTPDRPIDPARMMASAVSPGGNSVSAVRRDAATYIGPVDLLVRAVNGEVIRCPAVACSTLSTRPFEGLWWAPGGHGILFLRREGWADSQLALYRWKPGSRHAHRIFVTDDLLVGCALTGHALLCGREASTQPRRLVLISTANGKQTSLFDPNPEFAALRLASARRLHWRSPTGVASYGDLVLPPGYHAGERRPLIIVQYLTRGFLRGGVGDEFPIQLFAQAGYAVLSFQQPPSVAVIDPASMGKTFLGGIVAGTKDWADRRNILSSLDAGIALLISRGIVDANNIGITGSSDGSTTVQFALVQHPTLFKAAAVGSCCVEPTGMMIYAGTGVADERRAWGYPPPSGPGDKAWQSLSIAWNADRIRTPLLLHLADHELLIALETYMALRSQKRPAELYVFPNEFHLKWQPAHRLAIYTRNLDWFNFWMLHRTDADPVKAKQYERWSAMRHDAGDGAQARVSAAL
jgi:dipeptidyl aminopeptidase/acylaminoacyl peptidase